MREIQYSDELNDEFSSFTTTPRHIDAEYVYGTGRLGEKLKRFICHNVIAYPIAYLYSKLAFHRKIVGRKSFRPFRGTGYFIYGNHTQPTGDALLQALLTYPQTTYVIVHPNNLSIPVIGRFTPALGGLPIPDGVGAYRNFRKAVERRIKEKHPVVIYPEAHIWPYYTGIRPFADTSFAYPVGLGVPAFCFVNTYQRRRLGRRPKMVTYIGGPFFPNNEVDQRTARRELRDQVYNCMVELSRHSNMEWIHYTKKENPNG